MIKRISHIFIFRRPYHRFALVIYLALLNLGVGFVSRQATPLISRKLKFCTISPISHIEPFDFNTLKAGGKSIFVESL
jgi:hypothetical protein